MPDINFFAGTVLLGTVYTHLFHPPNVSSLRVLPSSHVSATSGTGVVHMAPAHGVEDYVAYQAAGLMGDDQSDIVCPVDNEGRFNHQIIELSRNPDFGQRLIGKNVQSDGNLEILNILEEGEVLMAQQKIKHKYPYDWRTKKPVMIRFVTSWSQYLIFS